MIYNEVVLVSSRLSSHTLPAKGKKWFHPSGTIT